MSEDDSLVRDAMDRTAAGLPALPDLVPGAVSQGRRRRARARLAVAAGTFGVATLTTLGAVALPGGGNERTSVGVGASGAGSPAPAPYRTPVHVEPTPGESEDGSLEGLPPAERERFEDFQQRAATALDEALPDAVGTILPIDSSVAQYQGEKDGKVFSVSFTVRPDDGEADGECRDIPSKKMTCETAELADGIEARVRVSSSGSMATTSTSISFAYGSSDVRLDIYPDEEAQASAPVSAEQLLDGVRESGLLDVVRYADEHPVLKKQVSVQGG
ncbi:hypothetical protein [Streptomyces sp. NPDC055749]